MVVWVGGRRKAPAFFSTHPIKLILNQALRTKIPHSVRNKQRVSGVYAYGVPRRFLMNERRPALDLFNLPSSCKGGPKVVRRIK